MPRKYDTGYSFQASETLRSQEQQRGEEGGQECALGNWCHAATRDQDGAWHAASTFQGFCPACRSAIASRLAALPEACVAMLVQIGERPKTGRAVRVPPGPREPIRLEIDALVRETAFVLGSWHERVAAVARLSPPRGHDAIQRPAKVIDAAVAVLSAHLDALLALPPEAMVRHFHRPKDAEARSSSESRESRGPWTAAGEDGKVLPSGEAYLLPALSGTDAGKEILDLHHRARKILGQTRALPEPFDGIPCRDCEAMSLERAEPPSDPRREAMHSRCADCGATMDKQTYDQWVSWYHEWASNAAGGLACRRCQDSRCDQCQWAACTCRQAGHDIIPAA